MRPLKTILLLLLVLPFTACEDDEGPLSPEIEIPTTYAFARDGQSTVAFPGQTDRIGMATETVTAMKDPASTLESLNNLFRNPEGVDPYEDAALNASTKSVRAKVAASAGLFTTNTVQSAAIKADFDGWLSAQVAEVFPAWNQLATPGEPGQVADGSSARYVNGSGLEYDQAFNKALIGGLMYDQLANNYLNVSVLDAGNNVADNDAGATVDGKPYTQMEHKWDEAYGYLFGAAADPARPLADLGNDAFLNKYLGRVEDDPDYAGIAATIEEAFRAGRAAIVAGDYAERDRQAEVIIENVSDVLAIRAVYYLTQGKAGLEANPQDFGGAFHDLSEGYGFIYSLRFIDGAYDESDAYLADIRNEAGNGFWDVDPAALGDVAERIATRYGIDLTAAGN